MKLLFRIALSGLFALSIHFNTNAQSNEHLEIDEDLVFYADVLVNADAPSHRVRAHNQFYSGIRNLLDKPGSFQVSLDSLKWISVQYPADRKFRIISWQLKKYEFDYEYFSFIQLESGNVVELKGTNALRTGGAKYSELTPDEYLPQLIYKVQMELSGEGKIYFIFGYTQLNQFTKLKTVDVLNLDGNQIWFGKPIFASQEENSRSKLRIILEYSADAQVSLIYNPGLDMIVHDHLIQRIGRLPGQGITFLPDGSYEGYKRTENGNWIYVEKIYNEVLNEAPRPKPVENDKSRDLFGRKKKNRG